MAYVYRHIRLDTNSVFYIGVGVGYRAYQKRGRNNFWERIVSKTKYDVEIIMDNLTWEDACEKEREFILLYGRRNKNKGTLVNMTDGGDGMVGYVATKETRLKLSASRKGIAPRPAGWKMTDEGKRKMSLAGKGGKRSLGRILSDDTKDKIRKSLIGKPPNNNIPVVQYTTNGVFVKEHNSAEKAGREMGEVNGGGVTMACRGRNGRKTCKGFLWKYRIDVMDELGLVLQNIEPLSKSPAQIETYAINRKSKKLTDIGVLDIKTSDCTALELAKKYSVTRTTIYAVKAGKNICYKNQDNSLPSHLKI